MDGGIRSTRKPDQDSSPIALRLLLQGRTNMMRSLLAFTCAVLLTVSADARAPARHHIEAATQAAESGLIERGHYINKSGQVVHSPAHTKSGKAPPGATAKCRDGSYSFSQHHRGTCSGHGGVNGWL